MKWAECVTLVGFHDCILAAKRRDTGADTTALEQDHRKQHGAGIDRLVCRRAASPLRYGYALYLLAPRLRQADGLTPAEIKLVEESSRKG